MRLDYALYWNELRTELLKSGFNGSLISEDDLFAIVNLNNGWILSFECEQNYAPAFTISIAPELHTLKVGKGYAVHLLMKVFAKKFQQSAQLPTIKNQVNFLKTQQKLLFTNPDFYSADYIRLNFIN
jgi:hypothetical protein